MSVAPGAEPGTLPRVLVSATHKSSGKTTVAIGVCSALAGSGTAVAPFKKGPDYIDPLWLSLAAGRACRNLDYHCMDEESIRTLFARHAAPADVALVEGTKGLHDGVRVDGADSNAALAGAIGTPVLLVVDTHGMTRGIAPLLRGLTAFEPQVAVLGVVLNRVGGSRHGSKLAAAVERYTDLPVLGVLGREPDLAIEERHLGLVPANEAGGAAGCVHRIAARVRAGVDADRILALAAAGPLAAPPRLPPPPRPDLRVAVVRDAAFGFYYPDDLDGLAAAGAEVVFANALEDAALPDVDALFIGGGFPECHLEALEANRSFRDSVRRRVAGGLPVYAECAGLMYLARRISWGARSAEMVGALPADVELCDRPQGRGYVVLEETGESPWPAAPGGAPRIPAHEFHHSRLTGLPADARFAYRVRRGHGIDGARDGLVHRNVLASYTHRRDVGPHAWTHRFVDFARACRSGAASTPGAVTA